MNARLSEKISLKRDFDSSQLGESRLKQEISLEARFHSTALFLKISCGAVVPPKLFFAVFYNF